ncbi:hypothetical protein B5E58_09880 [Tyzzerella sp. An114]|uniref:PF20097 family protein n=1 Tax=Tyzzerella sp. An114 TaxID=1965545 RepID=UPI000B436770|nr:PF20097 family protein [Tyzzerella sp. An114]OUQ56954.1 hypothetical protein B5E58_09880 [Tyzzerella sp. An114]
MKCPYCNSEMEQGFLHGMKRVAWMTKKRKSETALNGDDIVFEDNAFNDFIFSGYICKDCKKMVIDYSDKNIKKAD